MAANILDHRYIGRGLTTSEMKTRMDYIKDTCPAAAPCAMTYIAQEGVFHKSMFGGAYMSVSAISWWKTGARLGFPDVLVNYAVPLVSAVGKSAGLRRQFLTVGFTYGSLRAQLGAEKGWTSGISLQRTEQKVCFFCSELNKKVFCFTFIQQ